MLPDRRLLALLAALLVLAGCATVPESVDLPALNGWETRNEVLGGIQDWQFRGRIAVKAGNEGFNAKFNWNQQGETFSATVAGPLGIGTVRIAGDGGSIVLTDKDGVETALENAESELRRRYGWTIPVTSLRYWALGIPDPTGPALTELNDDDLLTRLEQRDWAVEISQYHEGGGQQMPRILIATNPDTRVRMVIDRWSFFDR